ncbi:MAG: ABC transporter ATP-binding protein [Candidatus Sericytochromatia bacterium]|nr:ABC transporter ATP-binding protein [Candidatus Tanganyikabacteria bacterium]
MDAAIAVADLAKRYELYDRPVDRLLQMAFRGRRTFYRDFRALDGVSFEIPRGRTVGVIGRNGSGKSTLLQILAGTLNPTGGTVAIGGRVSALLELGAGFNPEFTGRENVFLNGAIMGIGREAMTQRFDRIAAFAEIGDFIDQPVKTYSSGMYVRLAFATAINVDPDILLIDEALAVGDAVFQYRCIRRIKELQAQGVTILFVSHDLSAVKSLCDRVMLLERGRLVAEGEPYGVINQYQALVMAEEERQDGAGHAAPDRGSFRHGNGDATLLEVAVLDADGHRAEMVPTGGDLAVRVRARAVRPLARPVIGFMLRNRLGLDFYGTNTELLGHSLPACEPGDEFEAIFRARCHLGPADYAITAAIHSADGLSCDWIDDAVFFKVLGDSTFEGLVNLHAALDVRSLREAHG